VRILHLTQDLAAAGAQRQLSYLAPELVRLGHEVHVAFVDGGPNLARLQSSGVALHHIGRADLRVARGRGLHNYDPLVLPRLTSLFRKIEPDIVQTWIQHMDILGGLACCLTRSRWILREPGSAIAYPPSLKTFARVQIARRAALIIVNSQEGDESWTRQAAKVPRVVIRNGVPIGEIEATQPAAPDVLGLCPDGRFILFAGRFEPCKNLPNLVRAVVAIARRTSGLKAVLCGKGPDRDIIRRLIAEQGAEDRFMLPGIVTNLWALMKRADLVVSVSAYEGCPNTVMEAMATRCPLIVSDIPAHRHLLNESAALFVNPGNPAAIADAIEATLSRPHEARERAKRARTLIEPLSVEAMAAAYHREYRNL
jgi:glycosyltransferase involved in cell wall biosynthesis